MMGLRQLVIERPSVGGMTSPDPVRVQVSDDTPIGPWMSTLAVRFQYPLFDRFGSPLAYRLRSCSSGKLLPSSGTFAQVRFPAEERFLLEPEAAAPSSRSFPRETAWGPFGHQTRYSRRTLLGVGGSLAFASLFGLGSGMATAIVLRKPSLTSVAGSHPLTLSQPVTVAHHGLPIEAVAWSADGMRLASCGRDALVCVWKPDGTLLQTLTFEAPVRALAFSPDGTQLLVGAGQVVFFFDGQSMTLLSEGAGKHSAQVTGLAWTQTRESVALSVGEDKQAIVWDGQTHQPRLIFGEHTTPIEAVSTCTNVVATASAGGVVRVWSALSGREVHGYFSENAQPQRALAFSSAGVLALGGDDGIVRLWQDGRGCRKQTPAPFGTRCVDASHHLVGHTRAVRALAFSPDGILLATGGDDGKLILWSVRRLVPLLTQTIQESVVSLSWVPSGNQLAAATGRQVLLFHRAGEGKRMIDDGSLPCSPSCSSGCCLR